MVPKGEKTNKHPKEREKLRIQSCPASAQYCRSTPTYSYVHSSRTSRNAVFADVDCVYSVHHGVPTAWIATIRYLLNTMNEN